MRLLSFAKKYKNAELLFASYHSSRYTLSTDSPDLMKPCTMTLSSSACLCPAQ